MQWGDELTNKYAPQDWGAERGTPTYLKEREAFEYASKRLLENWRAELQIINIRRKRDVFNRTQTAFFAANLKR
jgi:hypothetical protein